MNPPPPPASALAFLSTLAPLTEAGEAFLPSADRLLGGHPLQRIWMRYQDPSAQFFVGEWNCEPGRWRVVYTEHEYCEILAGRIRIESEDGQTREVGPGDRFVVRAGFRGIWEVTETARKVFVVFEPKS